MGWIYYTVGFTLVSIVLQYFNLNVVSVILTCAAVALLFFQLIIYKHVTAPLFPKKESQNVIAFKKPTGEVKRRIIFSGHVDATWEWGWHNLGGFNLLLASVILALVGLLFNLVTAVIGLAVNGITPAIFALGGWYSTLVIVMTIISAPLISLMFFFSNPFFVVDGANDNLTACFTSVAVLKSMAEEGIELEHTEVGAMMAGSEEAGLRGAYAYAKAHKAELDADAANGIETVFVVLETLRDQKFFSVFAKDMNAIYKNDAQVCKLISNAGAEVIGRPLPFGKVELGSTDAAAFSQYGLKSTCFAGMNHKVEDYYHTRKDTYLTKEGKINIDKETLRLAHLICLKSVEMYDRDGLPQ
jgi:hypothetical protein